MREYGYQFIPEAIKRTFLMRNMNKISGVEKNEPKKIKTKTIKYSQIVIKIISIV